MKNKNNNNIKLKPIIFASNPDSFDIWAKCPTCGTSVYSGPAQHDTECPKCKQELDWSAE